MNNIIYDIIAIGIGPFNLGLAAILNDLPELKAVFVEQNESFNWHPGLLLPTARMQVPYYADLVTIVNPQSPFTYTNFLQKTGRFFKFANHDNPFPLRVEYNRYCQWVAGQLKNLRFGLQCVNILYDERSAIYKVECRELSTGALLVFHAKHIVLGTGTQPVLPECLQSFLTGPVSDTINQPMVLHAGNYLFNKAKLLTKQHITIIGSGQSAAEVFNDLLPYADEFESLSWFTRSNRFHPMDYSRFTTEMTSMDYIDHFYELEELTKERVLQEQHHLYKGINHSLIAQINDTLYIRHANGAKDNVRIRANCALLNASLETPPAGHDNGAFNNSIALHLQHRETSYHFKHTTQAVIAATGYAYKLPAFLASLHAYMQWSRNGLFQVNKNYSIDRVNTLFVQNADLHTHGFNSADLGMGPYRNAVILNTIVNRAHFILERNTGFQTF